MFSLEGCVIESSSSSYQIGTLNFNFDDVAEFAQTVELNFTELIVSDVDGNSVQFGSVGSSIILDRFSGNFLLIFCSMGSKVGLERQIKF